MRKILNAFRLIRGNAFGLAAGTGLAVTSGMNDAADILRTPRPRFFQVLKFSLYGLLVDLLIVVGWVLYVMLATVGGGCDGDPCTAAEFFRSRVVFAFQIGVGLMIFLWVILMPLLAAPPVAGFVIDCVRNSRPGGDG